MNVRKRNGSVVPFDALKIEKALSKAFIEVDKGITEYSQNKIKNICEYITNQAKEIEKFNEVLNIEDIQDMCENGLMSTKRRDVARAYIRYRYKRELARQTSKTYDGIIELVEMQNDELKDENSNKNAVIASTQRDYIAGEVSKDITNRFLIPESVRLAHETGEIHFHDSDYFIQHIINCCLVNLRDMLGNGTVINKTLIERPKTFSTACTIATQIMAVVASGQYGGQSISLTHLAPFVQASRNKFYEQVKKELDFIDDEEVINKVVEQRVLEDIKNGVQTMQYQINTLNTSNGQTPFVTVFMYLNEAKDEQEKKDLALIIEEVLRQRYIGTKNEKGAWITPAFPKLIYVTQDDNIYPNTPYFYLTELAAKCSAKRLTPDYISEKKMKELKLSKGETIGNGDCYPCMGCRSFLTPDRSGNGFDNVAKAKDYGPGPKYYGRFNQGVVTINLVDVACSVNTKAEFWDLLEKRLQICHLGLRCRHERLLGTCSDISPIHFQYGALARLDKGEVIDKLLYNGYSTLSLGYAGLWECVYKITGEKLTEPEGKKFGLEVMRKLNDACAKWKAAENIDYSLYGTPIESTTYKFAKCLKDKFGIIPDVTDKDYITNSYHIKVTEPIDAFNKISIESEFQALSPGGAITYVEVPNLNNNIEAVITLIQYIHENLIYGEINTKSDYCQNCGFDGEIEIVEQEDGKLDWRCPQCGNMNHDKMNIARRTCGYIGSNYWNQGRTQEIKERVLHL